MSYHIYTTKGIVLGSRDWREADRIYNILTRDFGLVAARALGVRKEGSKLRGALEPLVLSSISLVRGKEFWRVTSAEFIKKITSVPEILRPFALLDKLVQGESAAPELFDSIEALLSEDSTDETFELKFVSETLYHLGYLKESDLKLDQPLLIQAINKGIHQSHLVG